MPDEVIEWEAYANRTVSKIRAIGGKLYLTNTRLIFSPNFFDKIFNGKAWDVTLNNIVSISRKPGRFSLSNLFNSGIRDRLKLELENGSYELFLVNNL